LIVCDAAGRRRPIPQALSRQGALPALSGVCVLLLALGACNQTDPPTPGKSYKTVAAIADAMEEGGVTCSQLLRSEEARLVREGGRCRIDGEVIAIRTFSDSTDLDDWIRVGSAFGENLVGPTWVITTRHRDTAEELREVLGGTLG